ncbi:hypothetical protein VIGAN_09073000 [Vigna angularis var. angularis]|uniref:Uncharacterized protein n=1 Tax=Vigna angularis var. angularis TaxID=157739 RepID=A0A0S3SXF3_PHAAN|nr:hypothetical protein VIGAN_09073000 [Vigna angularis var. angularis]
METFTRTWSSRSYSSSHLTAWSGAPRKKLAAVCLRLVGRQQQASRWLLEVKKETAATGPAAAHPASKPSYGLHVRHPISTRG